VARPGEEGVEHGGRGRRGGGLHGGGGWIVPEALFFKKNLLPTPPGVVW
jgi:hypothetical protein